LRHGSDPVSGTSNSTVCATLALFFRDGPNQDGPNLVPIATHRLPEDKTPGL
jgi:hypothetical protein